MPHPDASPPADFADPLLLRLIRPRSTNPRDRAAWTERRARLRADLRFCLGLDAVPERLALNPRETPVRSGDGWALSRVEFQTWPGAASTGWRLHPTAEGRYPAVLAIGAEPWTPVSPAALASLLPLARSGIATLILDGLDLERPELGLSTAGVLAAAHLRAIDFLAAHPKLDPARVGLLAWGWGSDLAAQVISLDERPAAAAVAPAAGFWGESLAAGAIEPRAVAPGVLRAGDRPELLASMAPRPLLLLDGGCSAPAERAAGAHGEILGIYGLYGLQERVESAAFEGRGGDPNEGPPPLQGGDIRPAADPGVAPLANLRRTSGAGRTGFASTPFEGLAPGAPAAALAWLGARLTGGDAESASQTGPEADFTAELAVPANMADAARQRQAIVEHFRQTVPAQPPKLESRPARKNYQARLRAQLQELLGEQEPEVPLDPLPDPSDLSSDASRETVSLRSAPGARVCLELWPSPVLPAPVLLCLAEDGDGDWTALREASAAVGMAFALLHTRLSLAGQSGWREAFHLTGRSAAGMAVRDAVAAVDYLLRRTDIDSRQVALLGGGAAGVVALLSAGGDERVAVVVADCGGTTYRDGGEGLPLLPGILRVADTPQLASLVAPRPLRLFRVPGERTGFSSRRYFDWTRRSYQSLGADEALRLDVDAAPEPGELVAWVRSRFRRR